MPFLSCCVKFNRLFQIDRFVFLFRDHADTLGTGDDAVQDCNYGLRFAFRHCSEQAAGGLRIKEKIILGWIYTKMNLSYLLFTTWKVMMLLKKWIKWVTILKIN